MNYTDVALFGLGILGVFLHNLVELNKLNKSTKGKAKLSGYLKSEIYSIIIAFIVVVVCIITVHEIKQLEAVGNYLGLAFVTIGYMGQSLLVAFMGRAKSKVDK